MPTLSVNFSPTDYKTLVRAKGKAIERTGHELNWHDALLLIVADFVRKRP